MPTYTVERDKHEPLEDEWYIFENDIAIYGPRPHDECEQKLDLIENSEA